MIDKFFTIEEELIEKEIIEKKSRFIGRLIKINSVEEANQKIAEIKKANKEARHNVFAYRLVNVGEKFSDDGEPSGTAGVPILDILRGAKLENVLVVVTRYFGGILLGTGGLVKAYSTVAKEAILVSKKIEMKLCDEYEIFVEYSYYDILNHYCKKNEIPIKNIKYREGISLSIIVRKTFSEKILKELKNITDRRITVNLVNTYYYI